jgi:hypothetical protein
MKGPLKKRKRNSVQKEMTNSLINAIREGDIESIKLIQSSGIAFDTETSFTLWGDVKLIKVMASHPSTAKTLDLEGSVRRIIETCSDKDAMACVKQIVDLKDFDFDEDYYFYSVLYWAAYKEQYNTLKMMLDHPKMPPDKRIPMISGIKGREYRLLRARNVIDCPSYVPTTKDLELFHKDFQIAIAMFALCLSKKPIAKDVQKIVLDCFIKRYFS